MSGLQDFAKVIMVWECEYLRHFYFWKTNPINSCARRRRNLIFRLSFATVVCFALCIFTWLETFSIIFLLTFHIWYPPEC